MGSRAERIERRSDNRLDILLDASANLFASQGYRETTMRDIAAAVQMLPGSIYYHFKSKDDLLVAVYREGVGRLVDQVREGIAGVEDPWRRLEQAMIAHLRAILAPSAYSRVLIRVLPDSAPKVAQQLIELRDTYEDRIADIIEGLPVRAGIDPQLLRFFVLGAANHTQLWFHEGRISLEDVARALVKLVRGDAAEVPKAPKPQDAAPRKPPRRFREIGHE